MQTWTGKLPERNVSWAIAEKALRSRGGTARVIYLGQRCALSTQRGATSPTKPSKYQRAFKQGATIVPRSFYFVRIPDFNGSVDPATTYWAETDSEQAKEAKKPYKEVKLTGLVEGRFIYSTAISKQVLPFVVLDPVTVALPITEKQGLLTMHTAEALVANGYREFGKWVREAERIWAEKRKGKAKKQNLYERLDYQRELTRQDLSQRHLVLYNHSGMNLAAAYFDRRSCALPFVVDVKLYWAAFRDVQEANYVAAVLNAEFVNAAIKPFQSTGLLGERDIHKKVLDLPIPVYDRALKEHQEVAELGERARNEAAAVTKSPGFPAGSSLARQRAYVRENLNKTLKEIDEHVRRILRG